MIHRGCFPGADVGKISAADLACSRGKDRRLVLILELMVSNAQEGMGASRAEFPLASP